MIKSLGTLQQKLIEDEGILLRGAISYGNLYLNRSQNIIVGEGLINAYNLESKAIHPRIILDRRFINKYFDGTDSMLKDTRYLLYEPPSPYVADFLYINYSRGVSFGLHRITFQKVIELLKNNFYNNEHFPKYEWLKRHFIFSCSKQHAYLESKPDKSKSGKRNIINIIWFLEELRKL